MSSAGEIHDISVVVPVYQGSRTLDALIAELEAYHEPFVSPAGHRARVSEVLLVDDCGPDGSAEVLRKIAARHPWVRPVWLSRNYGQHAATLAGMSSSGGDWVVTMDEDGQQDPADMAGMLDVAMARDVDVVYGAPLNEPPHGLLRNVASAGAKRSLGFLSGLREARDFNSYRFVLGEVARSVAAGSGSGVYLDVALGWVSRGTATAPVTLRAEGDRPSGYGWRRLMSHYGRMVITGGTRLLRVVSLVGGALAVLGFLLAVGVVVARLAGQVDVAGWTSVMTVLLILSGVILVALGIVAEYVGVAVNMAMGRPLYVVVRDRDAGPHGRLPTAPPAGTP